MKGIKTTLMFLGGSAYASCVWGAFVFPAKKYVAGIPFSIFAATGTFVILIVSVKWIIDNLEEK